MKSAKHATRKYVILLPYVFLFLIFLWRSFYSFDISDEAYYGAIAYRIVLGEPLFSTSWDATQLSALIYAPILFLYRMIRGNMDGCILMLRVVFLIVSFISALWVFRKICGSIFSYKAFLCVTFFMPACLWPLATFNYNSLLLVFSLLSFGCAYCAKKEGKFGYAVLCGLFFAFAVQSYPTALLCLPVYLLYFLSFDKVLGKKLALGYIIGGGIVLLIFLVFLSIQSSFSALLNNFHYLLNDPEHVRPSPSIKSFFKKLILFLNLKYFLCILIVLGCASACQKFIFKKEITKETSLIIISTIITAAVLRLIKNNSLPQQFHILSLFYLFLLPVNRFKYDDSAYLFLLGLGLSIAVSLASNSNYPSNIYPAVFCALAVITFFPEVISGKAVRIVKIEGLAVALILMVSSLIPVYRDEELWKLNVRMTNGPAMGILTTGTREEQYSKTVELIKKHVPSDGNVLFTPLLPYGYLCTDAGIASPSLWRRNLSYPGFDDYYSQNPEKLPRAIFVVDSNYGYQSGWGTNYPTKEEYCDTFKTLFEEIPYQEYKIQTGTLYVFDEYTASQLQMDVPSAETVAEDGQLVERLRDRG